MPNSLPVPPIARRWAPRCAARSRTLWRWVRAWWTGWGWGPTPRRPSYDRWGKGQGDLRGKKGRGKKGRNGDGARRGGSKKAVAVAALGPGPRPASSWRGMRVGLRLGGIRRAGCEGILSSRPRPTPRRNPFLTRFPPSPTPCVRPPPPPGPDGDAGLLQGAVPLGAGRHIHGGRGDRWGLGGGLKGFCFPCRQGEAGRKRRKRKGGEARERAPNLRIINHLHPPSTWPDCESVANRMVERVRKRVGSAAPRRQPRASLAQGQPSGAWNRSSAWNCNCDCTSRLRCASGAPSCPLWLHVPCATMQPAPPLPCA